MNKPRLIDANDVLEILELHQTEPDGISWAIREITDLPTAYDIDKVVEQLERFSNSEVSLWASDELDYDAQERTLLYKPTAVHGYAINCYQNAIDIVKGGEVDDETMA